MGRTISVLAFASALLGAAACVDLFHSTDFDTLCTADAAACAVDDSGSTKPDTGKPATEAGVKEVNFCIKYASEDAAKAAQRVCAWMNACLPSTQDGAYANCYARALAAFDCEFNPFLRPRGEGAAFWDCLSDVDSCSKVEACVFRNSGAKAPTCNATSGGKFTQCNIAAGDGSPASVATVECGPSTIPLSFDACELNGQACFKTGESTATCAGKAGIEASCPDTPRCTEGHAVSCAEIDTIKTDVGIDCTRIGSGACVAKGSVLGCAPNAGAPGCSASTPAVTCAADGTTAESCVQDAKVRIDCSKLKQVCGEVGAKSFDPISACKAAASECTDERDTCANGVVLQSCRGGTRYNFTCSQVPGLSGCDATGGIAHCVPQ